MGGKDQLELERHAIVQSISESVGTLRSRTDQTERRGEAHRVGASEVRPDPGETRSEWRENTKIPKKGSR